MKRLSILAALAAVAVGTSGLVASASVSGATDAPGAPAAPAAGKTSMVITKATHHVAATKPIRMPTYSFTDIVNPADPTFNQALGINDKG